MCAGSMGAFDPLSDQQGMTTTRFSLTIAEACWEVGSSCKESIVTVKVQVYFPKLIVLHGVYSLVSIWHSALVG